MASFVDMHCLLSKRWPHRPFVTFNSSISSRKTYMYVCSLYGFYMDALFTYVSIVLANSLVYLNKCTCTKFDGGPGFRTVIPIQPTQIVVIPWADLGILLAILLSLRWQMTLAQRHFAHLTNNIAKCWSNLHNPRSHELANELPIIFFLSNHAFG